MHNGSSFFSQIPPVTKNLIIINLIVWLAMFVLPGRLGTGLENFGGLHYFLASDFNPAQLITYMFMHSTQSFAHIFFNMFSLWMFGMALERTLGSARFLFYYVSCGVGAALVQELVWALTWEDTMVSLLAKYNAIDFPEAREYIGHLMSTPDGKAAIAQNLNMFVTIGASGAVYGILLAFGMLYPNAPLYLFFIPVPIKAKWMVIGMGAIEVLIGLSEAAGKADGIAHFAHLGGMIFGLLIILYWKKKGTFHGGY
ncbi:rhomboid family intramembrane serine protease [uncultured Duncaniella sp.]|uniref:rhomboid family intramembrane serine protease n=1 Tax=uncultured Duncaniella sp. TaxID=2768039 RepID=UPI0023C9FE43|nr:rhomboid family intramembrane serine protease [uncultured Duncaniella sp.]MDE5666448.1 rhomboid family intramembrane serine protease [Duncaniella sp.]MDE5672780.1 rhomboid family intramembrane serine protease [Duncaniella sp.]MDE5954784.1 rhomboid family intramembrane serine protease [Duncaniella sp.]MDE6188178.1 rhomboid family intramembrane serine protease [Duncaniella sp.]